MNPYLTGYLQKTAAPNQRRIDYLERNDPSRTSGTAEALRREADAARVDLRNAWKSHVQRRGFRGLADEPTFTGLTPQPLPAPRYWLSEEKGLRPAQSLGYVQTQPVYGPALPPPASKPTAVPPPTRNPAASSANPLGISQADWNAGRIVGPKAYSIRGNRAAQLAAIASHAAARRANGEFWVGKRPTAPARRTVPGTPASRRPEAVAGNQGTKHPQT